MTRYVILTSNRFVRSSSATKLEVKEYVSRFVSRTRLELQNGFLSFKTFNDEPYLAENVYCITCDVGDSLQLPGFQPKTLVSASPYANNLCPCRFSVE